MPGRIGLVPLNFRDACGFVAMWNRHHAAPVGCKCCIGVADEQRTLHGVAIVGRPVARFCDDGMTLEVTRLTTDGTRNACSMLYAAAWKVCKNMGYHRLITYSQQAGILLRQDRGPRHTRAARPS